MGPNQNFFIATVHLFGDSARRMFHSPTQRGVKFLDFLLLCFCFLLVAPSFVISHLVQGITEAKGHLHRAGPTPQANICFVSGSPGRLCRRGTLPGYKQLLCLYLDACGQVCSWPLARAQEQLIKVAWDGETSAGI